MKKGILKVLGITALIAVSSLGGLALGAEISNGFEKTYSESAYIEYGNEQKEQGKQEGYEAGLAEGYTEEELQEAVNAEVDKWQEFLKLTTSNSFFTDYLRNGSELWFSTNEDVEGLFIYTPQTGELNKIIDKGYNYSTYHFSFGNFIYSDFEEQVGLRFIDKDGNIITIEEIGCAYSFLGNYDTNNILISSQKGLMNFDITTMTTTMIKEGSGWMLIGDVYGDRYFSNSNPDKPGLYKLTSMTTYEMVASEGYNYIENMVQYEEEEVVYWINVDGLVKINDDKTVDVVIEGNLTLHGSDLIINHTDSKLYYYKHNEGFVETQLDFNVMRVSLLNYDRLYLLMDETEQSYIFDGNKSQIVKVVGIENEQIYDCLATLDSGEGISKIVVFTSENKLYQIDLSTGTATLIKEHTNSIGIGLMTTSVYTTFNEDNSQSLYIIKFTDGTATSEPIKENMQYIDFIGYEDNGNIAHFVVVDMEGQEEDLYIDITTFEVVEQ